MESLLFSFLAGTSTVVGVLILMVFRKPSKKVMALILGFAGGIMAAISVFELMPESVDIGTLLSAVIGFLLGVALMYGLDLVLPHSHLSEQDHLVTENQEKLSAMSNPMARTGFLILFGIALHNLPEGLAIGAGYENSPQLGLVIAVAIALHNIPEGLAIAGPLRAGGLAMGKIFIFTLGAGLMTPLGTAIGLLLFAISPVLVGASLAFAAGAMIYIVFDELVPQANSMHSHLANIGIISGLVLGFIIF